MMDTWQSLWGPSILKMGEPLSPSPYFGEWLGGRKLLSAQIIRHELTFGELYECAPGMF